MDEILKDERFKHVVTDPKFKIAPKSHRKVKIDKRFQGIFTNKKFQVKYVVDKRGRPINQSSSENFRKYYDLSSSDEKEDDNNDSESESDKSEDEGTKLNNNLKNKGPDVGKISNNVKKGKKKTKHNKRSSEGDSFTPVNSQASETNVSSEESDDDDEEEEEDEIVGGEQSSKLDDIKKRNKIPDNIREKLHNISIDYARGMEPLMTDDSSSDEESGMFHFVLFIFCAFESLSLESFCSM